MRFNYTNELRVAIHNYLTADADRRKFLAEPELVFTNEIYTMFYKTIAVYEECITDFFHFYGIDTDFLKNRVRFTIEQFPWIFNYVFSNGLHAFSLDVNINYDKMTITFSTIMCKYTEGNVIYVHTIPDKHLRKLDLNSLPITTMIEQEIPSITSGFKESTVYFTLKYDISSYLHEQLYQFNNFIDTHMGGLRLLFDDITE